MNILKQTNSTAELLKLIEPYTNIVVVAPWNGKQIPVTIRMLDSVTLNACGEFNTVSAYIDLNGEDTEEESSLLESIVKTKNIHENILRYALVHPTFDELYTFMTEQDFYITKMQEIERYKEEIEKLTSMEQKQKMQNKLQLTELALAFMFPEDFTATIVSIILQKEATDMQKLTEDTLFRAGLLGEKYNTRPSDYIEGTFSNKQKEDIDVACLMLVANYRNKKKLEQESKMRWIRGKGKGKHSG